MEIPVKAETEWMDMSPGRNALVLMWHEETVGGVTAQKLPVPLDADGAYAVVQSWLKAADYKDPPDDDDISSSKGYRLYCDFWGHVENFQYAVIGIVPAWAMSGK